MKTVVLNRFDGGIAEDIRNHNLNECETSDNLDMFTNSHKITPYVDLVAETVTSGTTTDYALTDVDSIIVAGTTSLVALGRVSSIISSPSFFRKDSSTNITSGWQHYADGVNIKVDGSLVVYKDYAYCLGDTSSAHNLQKFDGASSVSTIGTITNTGYSNIVPRPFVHPEDNILYMADGNIIATYNGSSFVAGAFTLPSNKVIVSMTNYGSYLVLVCRPKNGAGNSTMYFWGRDTSSTLLQESIDLGNTQVNIVENIENQLVVVSTKIAVGNYSNITQNKLTISMYSGGSMQTVKEIVLSSSLGTGLNNIKIKKGNKLYFVMSGDSSIYCFGKNKSGQYVLNHDRSLPASSFIYNISMIGDTFWLSYASGATSYYFARSLSLSETFTSSSSLYRTSINPSMTIYDRGILKKLIGVQVIYSTTGASSVLTVKYKVDGGSLITLGAKTITTAETGTIEMTSESTGIPFLDGREYQFQVEATQTCSIVEIRYKYETLNQLV